jgi:hypothetical protein
MGTPVMKPKPDEPNDYYQTEFWLKKYDDAMEASSKVLRKVFKASRYIVCVSLAWIAGIYAGLSFLVLFFSGDVAGFGGFFSLAYYLHVLLPGALCAGSWYLRRSHSR